MRISRLLVRDFRSYAAADVALGGGVTVLSGANGAGKTNLLEALYFGCTGRSCRTANEREVVRLGATAARVEVDTHDADGPHRISVGFVPGQPKRMQVDGASIERLLDSPVRPLLSVFLPGRLELVKGSPALRRAHLDQLVAALWPARAATRQSFGRTLVQRNALLVRVQSGVASRASLRAWDHELARHALALMADRAAAAEALAEPFWQIADALGLGEAARLTYRPRSQAGDAVALAAELQARWETDLLRGHTAHGPHRDELALRLGGRDLRAYGSQGQQRLALLALLLAERVVIAARRGPVPAMLLDDVMSELDADRRRALVDLIAGEGQAIITTTDRAHVPDVAEMLHLHVTPGRVLGPAEATRAA